MDKPEETNDRQAKISHRQFKKMIYGNKELMPLAERKKIIETALARLVLEEEGSLGDPIDALRVTGHSGIYTIRF